MFDRNSGDEMMVLDGGPELHLQGVNRNATGLTEEGTGPIEINREARKGDRAQSTRVKVTGD